MSHASREGTHAHQQCRLVVECLESLGTETRTAARGGGFVGERPDQSRTHRLLRRHVLRQPGVHLVVVLGRPHVSSQALDLSLSLSLDWHFCRILGREVFLWETLLYQAFLFSFNSSSNSSSNSSIRGVNYEKLTSIAEIPPIPQNRQVHKVWKRPSAARWARGGEAGGARTKVWRGWRGWSNRRFKRSPGLPSRSRACALVAKTTARRGFL